MNILCCSGGNDSIALMQWAKINNLKNVTVLYNDTQWSKSTWIHRISEVELFCIENNFKFESTKSEGFKDMVRRKKGFPMSAGPMQWCSGILKKEPTAKWLKENDPDQKAVIYIGIRREESKNRENHPEEIIFSEEYGSRLQKFPLVEYKERERDFLIDDAGFDILLHSSRECWPCVNANRSDLRLLAKDEERVAELEALEKEMGFTKHGNARVMFRHKRHMGAIGIREVIKWALCERGKYKKPELYYEFGDI